MADESNAGQETQTGSSGQEPSGQTDSVGATTNPDISQYIGSDGKFQAGWIDALVPEELRGSSFYKIPSDVQSLLKIAGNQAKTIGKYSTEKGLLPINEKSTPEEIEAFRGALGIPKDGTGYKYEPPKEIKSADMTAEAMAPVLSELNKAHYTQAQVDTFVKVVSGYLNETERAMEQELQKEQEEAEKQIRAAEEDNYESRLRASETAIEKIVGDWPPDMREKFFGKKEWDAETNEWTYEGGIVADAEYAHLRPYLFRIFADIGQKFGMEASAARDETAGGTGKSVQDQINELEATPGFMDGQLRTSLDPKDRAKHEEILKKRLELYGKLGTMPK